MTGTTKTIKQMHEAVIKIVGQDPWSVKKARTSRDDIVKENIQRLNAILIDESEPPEFSLPKEVSTFNFFQSIFRRDRLKKALLEKVGPFVKAMCAGVSIKQVILNTLNSSDASKTDKRHAVETLKGYFVYHPDSEQRGLAIALLINNCLKDPSANWWEKLSKELDAFKPLLRKPKVNNVFFQTLQKEALDILNKRLTEETTTPNAVAALEWFAFYHPDLQSRGTAIALLINYYIKNNIDLDKFPSDMNQLLKDKDVAKGFCENIDKERTNSVIEALKIRCKGRELQDNGIKGLSWFVKNHPDSTQQQLAAQYILEYYVAKDIQSNDIVAFVKLLEQIPEFDIKSHLDKYLRTKFFRSFFINQNLIKAFKNDCEAFEAFCNRVCPNIVAQLAVGLKDKDEKTQAQTEQVLLGVIADYPSETEKQKAVKCLYDLHVQNLVNSNVKDSDFLDMINFLIGNMQYVTFSVIEDLKVGLVSKKKEVQEKIITVLKMLINQHADQDEGTMAINLLEDVVLKDDVTEQTRQNAVAALEEIAYSKMSSQDIKKKAIQILVTHNLKFIKSLPDTALQNLQKLVKILSKEKLRGGEYLQQVVKTIAPYLVKVDDQAVEKLLNDNLGGILGDVSPEPRHQTIQDMTVEILACIARGWFVDKDFNSIDIVGSRSARIEACAALWNYYCQKEDPDNKRLSYSKLLTSLEVMPEEQKALNLANNKGGKSFELTRQVTELKRNAKDSDPFKIIRNAWNFVIEFPKLEGVTPKQIDDYFQKAVIAFSIALHKLRKTNPQLRLDYLSLGLGQISDDSQERALVALKTAATQVEERKTQEDVTLDVQGIAVEELITKFLGGDLSPDLNERCNLVKSKLAQIDLLKAAITGYVESAKSQIGSCEELVNLRRILNDVSQKHQAWQTRLKQAQAVTTDQERFVVIKDLEKAMLEIRQLLVQLQGGIGEVSVKLTAEGGELKNEVEKIQQKIKQLHEGLNQKHEEYKQSLTDLAAKKAKIEGLRKEQQTEQDKLQNDTTTKKNIDALLPIAQQLEQATLQLRQKKEDIKALRQGLISAQKGKGNQAWTNVRDRYIDSVKRELLKVYNNSKVARFFARVKKAKTVEEIPSEIKYEGFLPTLCKSMLGRFLGLDKRLRKLNDLMWFSTSGVVDDISKIASFTKEFAKKGSVLHDSLEQTVKLRSFLKKVKLPTIDTRDTTGLEEIDKKLVRLNDPNIYVSPLSPKTPRRKAKLVNLDEGASSDTAKLASSPRAVTFYLDVNDYDKNNLGDLDEEYNNLEAEKNKTTLPITKSKLLHRQYLLTERKIKILNEMKNEHSPGIQQKTFEVLQAMSQNLQESLDALAKSISQRAEQIDTFKKESAEMEKTTQMQKTKAQNLQAKETTKAKQSEHLQQERSKLDETRSGLKTQFTRDVEEQFAKMPDFCYLTKIAQQEATAQTQVEQSFAEASVASTLVETQLPSREADKTQEIISDEQLVASLAEAIKQAVAQLSKECEMSPNELLGSGYYLPQSVRTMYEVVAASNADPNNVTVGLKVCVDKKLAEKKHDWSKAFECSHDVPVDARFERIEPTQTYLTALKEAWECPEQEAQEKIIAATKGFTAAMAPIVQRVHNFSRENDPLQQSNMGRLVPAPLVF